MSNCCLPQELVKIFSAKSGDGNTVLDLQDRVRSMAVCKAWRSYLDPRKWPIQECCLEEANAKLGDWLLQMKPAVQKLHISFDSFEDEDTDSLGDQHFDVAYNVLPSLQPRAALEELKLTGKRELVERFLPALNSFPNLKFLHLASGDYGNLSLDSEHLSNLPMLAKLEVSGCDSVNLFGSTGLLLNLQHLELHEAGLLLLDMALPQLHTLVVGNVETLVINGECLQLPALTHLSILHSDADIDLQRLTGVQELSLRGAVFPPGLDGLALPHHLASLHLDCYHPDQQVAAAQLLRSGSESLQQLELRLFEYMNGDELFFPLEPSLAAALCASTYLTALTLRASGPLPAQLGALSRLQALRLSSRLEDLTSREMIRLGRLGQLRHLVLAASQVDAGEEAMLQGALELLRSALPTSCLVKLE